MNTNMFDLYYNYKIKTVLEYSMLLSKILGIEKNKLLSSKKKTEEVLKKVIEDYFERLNYAHKPDTKLIRCFLTNKDIFKFHLDSELLSVINYFTASNNAFEIKANEKEIILTAVLLKIANELDIITSPFKENKNNYKTILFAYIEKYRQINFINIIDDGHKKTNTLLELIKTNVRKERKIFEGLTSNISFNKYIKVSNYSYISQYNYSVPGLNKYNKSAVQYIYQENNIDDEFVNISADLISVTLMKLLSVRLSNIEVLLPLKKDFLESDINIKKISYLFKNKYLANHVKVLINYQDFNNNMLKLLTKYQAIFYLYCSVGTKITDTFKKENCNAYLISNDFNERYQEIINKEINDDIIIIREKYQGIFTDKELIKENGGELNE